MKFIINVKSLGKHEIHPNDLNFKAYVCHVQTKVYIHIPKHNWVQNIDLHEKQMTQGAYMYILSFGKIDIYMKWKHFIIENTSKIGIHVWMHESSKLDYTSTFNGYK